MDCKYNPNSESPKTEFPQQPQAQHAGQPAAGQQPQHPNSGKENNNVSLEVVKTEPTFGGLGTNTTDEDAVVVELQQFVNSATANTTPTTTTTAPTQIILVCELVVCLHLQSRSLKSTHALKITMAYKSGCHTITFSN